MTEPLQVSLEEAARLLGYSKRTVQRMAENKDIIATGTGRLRRYDMASIVAKQARMREGEPPICEKKVKRSGGERIVRPKEPIRVQQHEEPKKKLTLLPMVRQNKASQH